MKITFNDGQELQIQQVTEQTDGALLIKTISAEEEQLKTLFSDAVATKRMSVSERDADTVTYMYTPALHICGRTCLSVCAEITGSYILHAIACTCSCETAYGFFRVHH